MDLSVTAMGKRQISLLWAYTMFIHFDSTVKNNFGIVAAISGIKSTLKVYSSKNIVTVRKLLEVIRRKYNCSNKKNYAIKRKKIVILKLLK